MLGPLGPQIDGDGGLVVNADPQPCLMEHLTTLKKRSDVAKPPGPDTFHDTQEENA